MNEGEYKGDSPAGYDYPLTVSEAKPAKKVRAKKGKKALVEYPGRPSPGKLTSKYDTENIDDMNTHSNRAAYRTDSPGGYHVPFTSKVQLENYPAVASPGKLVNKRDETEEIDHMNVHSNMKDYRADSPKGYHVPFSSKVQLENYPAVASPGKLVNKRDETEEIDHMHVHSNMKDYRSDAPKGFEAAYAV